MTALRNFAVGVGQSVIGFSFFFCVGRGIRWGCDALNWDIPYSDFELKYVVADWMQRGRNAFATGRTKPEKGDLLRQALEAADVEELEAIRGEVEGRLDALRGNRAKPAGWNISNYR